MVAARRRTAVRWAGVLVLVGGLTSCGSGPTAQLSGPLSGTMSGPPPAHHTTTASEPSPVPAVDLHGAQQIVDSPQARLGAFATIPGHPGRRIAEWYVCRDRRCYHRTYAMAVSSDGFRTTHVVGLGASRVSNGWYLEPAGPDHFAVSPNGGRRALVSLTGHVTRLQVSGSPGPLKGGEVPLRASKAGFLAVDPATGHAHPLSTPDDGVVDVEETASGQLRALTYDHPRYFWSDDGGATWREIPLPAQDTDLSAELVPSTSDSQQVLLLGGENTVFPWDDVLRSTDGRTWTTYRGPDDPRGYVDESVVLPDGRLLMNVDGWSDQYRSRPSVNLRGLWAGSDWSRLRPVPPAGPFAGQDVHGYVPSILDIAVTSRSVALYALTPDQRGVVASTDGGEHWRRVRAH